jgi:hypothetical protein
MDHDRTSHLSKILCRTIAMTEVNEVEAPNAREKKLLYNVLATGVTMSGEVRR